MSLDKEIKVVGQSMNSTTGQAQVTFEVPVSSLRNGEVDLAVGSWSNGGHMGKRYGLRDDMNQTAKVPTERDEMITLARDIYTNEPLVANVVDLMVDLCMTGMENRTTDPEAKRVFDIICKYGNVDALHRQIFKEYFISSDVFPMRGDPKVVQWGPDQGEIYFDYMVVNTRYVEVTGPLVFNAEKIGIKANTEANKALQDDPKLGKKLPAKMRTAIKKNETFYPDERRISRISRKRQPYERYATPFLTRIFEPVLLKRRMREADLALVETVRSVLVTITIGDKDFPATQPQLDAVAALFANPSKSMELFWNHTLKVEYHYPDAELFNTDKYKQVNQDILQGLGIPPVLIDGGGGTFATAFTSLLSVMERLESARAEVARWQEAEYLKIAEELNLNIKEIPSVVFKPLNLRDDKVIKTLLLELFDRGMVSRSTVLEYADFDLDVELARFQEEKDKKVDEIAPLREVNNPGGRPTDKLDDGQYEERDKQPEIDDDSPKNSK